MTGTGALSIYDAAFLPVPPDVSTPALATAVRFENLIRHNADETGVFIDMAGAIVTQKTGSPDQVIFQSYELNGTDKTLFTHNHPLGGSFSSQDLQSAIDSDLLELRAVGPMFRYRMRAPSGWPTMRSFLGEVKRRHQDAKYRVATLLKPHGPVDQRFAQLEAENQLWDLVSASLGLVYERQKS